MFQVCVWERAGDRTLLKYFDPKVMAVSVVSFSFFMAAQPDPGVNSSVCWLSLLHRVYLRLPLYCLPSSRLSLTVLNSSALYYLCHVIAHGDEEVRLILSSRIEWEYQAVKKWPLGENVGHGEYRPDVHT